MSSISDKMDYLKETKSAIKEAIQDKGVTVLETDTFRSYAEKIASIDGSGSGGSITDAELGAATLYKIIFNDGQLHYSYDYVEEDALAVATDMLKDLSEGKQVLVYLGNGDNVYCRGFAYCTKLATSGSPSRYISFSGYTGTTTRMSDYQGASRLKIDVPYFGIKYNPNTLEAEALSFYFNSISFSVLETNRNYSTVYVPTKDFHPATKKYVDDTVANSSSTSEPKGGQGYFGWYGQAPEGTDLASEYGASVDGMFSMTYGDIYEWPSTLTNGTMGGVVYYIHQYTGRDMDWNQYYIKSVMMGGNWYEYSYNGDHIYKGSTWPEESGGLACFVGDTKVLTPSGLVNIKDIKVGDEVVSIDMKTEKIENKKVSRLINHKEAEIYVITTDNDVIQSTGDHPFMTQEYGRVIAKTLKKDFVLLDKDKKEHKIKKIEKKKIDDTVYEIAVEDNHTYFVGESNIQVFNEASVTLNKA